MRVKSIQTIEVRRDFVRSFMSQSDVSRAAVDELRDFYDAEILRLNTERAGKVFMGFFAFRHRKPVPRQYQRTRRCAREF